MQTDDPAINCANAEKRTAKTINLNAMTKYELCSRLANANYYLLIIHIN